MYTQGETGRNQITPGVKQNTADHTRSETDHNEVHPEGIKYTHSSGGKLIPHIKGGIMGVNSDGRKLT